MNKLYHYLILWEIAEPEDMMNLSDLLAVTHIQALRFFFVELKDASGGSNVTEDELKYNASILAHHSQISTVAETDFPTPANLSAIYEHFIADPTLHQDILMMEAAAAQCLLLSGFFEDQMRRRYNIRWYSELGAGFFSRAADLEQSSRKSQLLYTMGKSFESWRRRHARLARELRDRPYLLPPPARPSG